MKSVEIICAKNASRFINVRVKGRMIMELNSIVKLIREEALLYENKEVYLPIELIDIINGREQERGWEKINVSKIMKYIADMMEE